MKSLELKIPPVLVVALTALLMWAVSHLAPSMTLSSPLTRPISLCLLLAGFMVNLCAFLEFRRARTTLNPIKPESSTALVVSGIYKHTRNPIYLGFLLALAAWAVWLAHPLPFGFLPAFILYMNLFQILPEERALNSIFGEAFKSYCSRVRRWI